MIDLSERLNMAPNPMIKSCLNKQQENIELSYQTTEKNYC